jgi:hypothetical protein
MLSSNSNTKCISYVAMVKPKLATRVRTRRANVIPRTFLYSVEDEGSVMNVLVELDGYGYEVFMHHRHNKCNSTSSTYFSFPSLPKHLPVPLGRPHSPR